MKNFDNLSVIRCAIVCIAAICIAVYSHPSIAQTIDDVERSELHNSCNLLSIADADCECLIRVSEAIGDNNIIGRLASWNIQA